MKRVTLFAGAGFSRAVSERVLYSDNQRLKMPLAREMFIYSQDYLDGKNFLDCTYPKLGTYIEHKFGSRTHKENYEKVYGQLKGENKHDLAEALEAMVLENLGVNYPPIRYKCEVEQTINIIRKFLLREEISQVITTNPDILLDIAIVGATEFDKEFLNLFGNFGKNLNLIEEECRLWQPVLSKAESRFKRLESIIRFVKVHGSITMAKKGSNFYWQSKYQWKHSISSAVYTHYGKYELCVIPPSPEKRYTASPWQDLMKETKDILRNTSKLIFYGFGFPDTDEALRSELEVPLKQIEEIRIKDIDASEEFKRRAINFLQVNEGRIKFNQIPGL